MSAHKGQSPPPGPLPPPPPKPVTVITASRGWFDWRLGQLWRYRDLISVFVWRDFVSVYKQTIFGPAWHIIRPVITTLIFTLVFSRIAGLSTDGAPPFLFYMVGTVLWMYFSTCLAGVSETFIANANLLGKVYFHRLVIPISIVVSKLIAFGIQLGILLMIMLLYHFWGASFRVTAWVFMLPLLLLVLAGYALGGGIIICAMSTRYRDFHYLATFGIQSFMYLTPVIYPLSAVSPKYRWAMDLNPLVPLFEGFRRALLGVGTVSGEGVALSACVMLAMLALGATTFTRVERTFVDTV